MATKNDADDQSTNQQGESNENRQRDATSATRTETMTSRTATTQHARPEGAIATRTRSQLGDVNVQQDAPGSTQSSAQSSPRMGAVETPAVTVNGTL